MSGDTLIGFHQGELAVQQRAGVTREAARLVGMLAPARLDGGVARFLAQREFAVLTGRDRDGALWTAPLLGPAGFLAAHGTTLDVHGTAGDPLGVLPAGQPVGLLAMEFALRRRLRVNGLLTGVDVDGMTIEVAEAFGNCPSYIQQRVLDHVAGGTVRASSATGALTGDQEAIIRRADTFFLGTTHPARGADTSHKGGPPGFVRIDGGDLWWPDYAGNNMFNSLGNIAVDPRAALLFVDFATGRTVALSGTAELEWITPGAPGDDGGTGRRIRFHPHRVVTAALPVRSGEAHPSPHNPDLTAGR
jgi:predicted pyridoxine 5'-phosphate oxidase superfamily flavin-nucleotide-binding protein